MYLHSNIIEDKILMVLKITLCDTGDIIANKWVLVIDV